MRHDQNGFGFVGLVVVVAVLVFISFVGWSVLRRQYGIGQKAQPKQQLHLHKTSSETGRIYRLQASIDSDRPSFTVLPGSDIMPGPGSEVPQCPHFAYDYSIRTDYRGSTLTISFLNVKEIRNSPKTVKSIDQCTFSLSKSIELDQDWLSAQGGKTVVLKGKSTNTYTLTTDDYAIRLQDTQNEGRSYTEPYLPNDVAILRVLAGDCSLERIKSVATSEGFPLAESKYPGIERLNDEHSSRQNSMPRVYVLVNEIPPEGFKALPSCYLRLTWQ